MESEFLSVARCENIWPQVSGGQMCGDDAKNPNVVIDTSSWK